jgi:hypothetical protein
MLDTERVLTADELLAATAVVDAVTGAPDSPEAIPTRP